MSKPVMMSVGEDVTKLQLVEQELHKRYGADYEVICEPSAAEALSKLEAAQGRRSAGRAALHRSIVAGDDRDRISESSA